MLNHEQPLILVAGGDADPNLAALLETLARASARVLPVLVGPGRDAAIAWDLARDELWIDGERHAPRAAFVRHDVFAHLADGRPATAFRARAWYTAITGWIAAHPEVRFLNRAAMDRVVNKAHALVLARAVGLRVPATLITNELAAARRFPAPAGPREDDDDDGRAAGIAAIAKPVGGGDYCRRLDDVLAAVDDRDGLAAAPAIVQPELVPPELRLYGIDGSFHAFEVRSPALDYRTSPETRVVPTSAPEELRRGLARLMAELGLRFAAADFKRCPATGAMLFLEINTGPMFAAFDRVADAALTRAIARFLQGPTRAAADA
ncbi:MAG: hypothetical protein KC468_34095 [Myxococcales bacterium]|nr:hypothetical protein [Myxococcales bacterium]